MIVLRKMYCYRLHCKSGMAWNESLHWQLTPTKLGCRWNQVTWDQKYTSGANIHSLYIGSNTVRFYRSFCSISTPISAKSNYPFSNLIWWSSKKIWNKCLNLSNKGLQNLTFPKAMLESALWCFDTLLLGPVWSRTNSWHDLKLLYHRTLTCSHMRHTRWRTQTFTVTSKHNKANQGPENHIMHWNDCEIK